MAANFEQVNNELLEITNNIIANAERLRIYNPLVAETMVFFCVKMLGAKIDYAHLEYQNTNTAEASPKHQCSPSGQCNCNKEIDTENINVREYKPKLESIPTPETYLQVKGNEAVTANTWINKISQVEGPKTRLTKEQDESCSDELQKIIQFVRSELSKQ